MQQLTAFRIHLGPLAGSGTFEAMQPSNRATYVRYSLWVAYVLAVVLWLFANKHMPSWREDLGIAFLCTLFVVLDNVLKRRAPGTK
jgi:hypothetical protein